MSATQIDVSKAGYFTLCLQSLVADAEALFKMRCDSGEIPASEKEDHERRISELQSLVTFFPNTGAGEVVERLYGELWDAIDGSKEHERDLQDEHMRGDRRVYVTRVQPVLEKQMFTVLLPASVPDAEIEAYAQAQVEVENIIQAGEPECLDTKPTSLDVQFSVEVHVDPCRDDSSNATDWSKLPEVEF